MTESLREKLDKILGADFMGVPQQPDEFTVQEAMIAYGLKRSTTRARLHEMLAEGKLTRRRIRHQGGGGNTYLYKKK